MTVSGKLSEPKFKFVIFLIDAFTFSNSSLAGGLFQGLFLHKQFGSFLLLWNPVVLSPRDFLSSHYTKV